MRARGPLEAGLAGVVGASGAGSRRYPCRRRRRRRTDLPLQACRRHAKASGAVVSEERRDETAGPSPGTRGRRRRTERGVPREAWGRRSLSTQISIHFAAPSQWTRSAGPGGCVKGWSATRSPSTTPAWARVSPKPIVKARSASPEGATVTNTSTGRSPSASATGRTRSERGTSVSATTSTSRFGVASVTRTVRATLTNSPPERGTVVRGAGRRRLAARSAETASKAG